MVIKKLFGTIGGIVLVMLLLLMVNQIIICHRLYRAERLHWGGEVTDILTKNIDSLVCVINKQLSTEACRYSEQTEATFFFSSLDRLVREELPENLKGVEFYYVAKKLTGELTSFFPDEKKNTANKVATPVFLSKEGEVFTIYFDLPLSLFWERSWQQLGSIFISFLLLLFLLAGIVYLNRRQRKLVSLQEGMMQQIVHDFNTPLNSVSTLLELLRENTKGIVSGRGTEKIRPYGVGNEQYATSQYLFIKFFESDLRYRYRKENVRFEGGNLFVDRGATMGEQE